MCFFYDSNPDLFRESRRRARKRHFCCECRLPILPGEEYQECFGVWSGDAATFRTCSTCEWFRERVSIAEMNSGCRSYESTPAFSELYEALSDGHSESIGLICLDTWHERR